MSRELPAKPNLDHLKNQAKELLQKARQGDRPSLEILRNLGRLPANARPTLSAAQHAVARDYGFASWPKLKRHVEALAPAADPAAALTAAIRAQDAAGVAKLLADRPELKARLDQPLPDYGSGMTALVAATQRSDRKTIDALLAAGANINARGEWWAGGVGVLDECSHEMAPFLLERGAAPDAAAAARLGMFDRLRELVTADPRAAIARGANGQTALHCASSLEIADFLLDHGAEIDAVDALHESTPAQHMLRVVQARHYPQDRQAIARRLVVRGCRTDILMAAALGDLEMARRCLQSDPDCIRVKVSEQYFPKRDPRSEGTIYLQLLGHMGTPHEVARDFGHEEVYQLLLQYTPPEVKLEMAYELGDEETFRAALALRPKSAELSAEDRRRLPDAAQSNNTEAVRLMLEAGWPIDAQGEYHLTALDWAAWHGNAAMVQLILRHHPPLERKDCDFGVTALGSALHGSMNSWHRDTGDYAGAVEALLEAGAKAPTLTDDLEASPAVREVLLRHAHPV